MTRVAGLVALAVIGAGCSLAPEMHLTPTARVVLAEFFTWQRCGYCPYAAHALDSLARESGDSVAVIAYHRRTAGDTLSPDYVEARCAFYYQSGGEPATVFDGGPVTRTTGPDENYAAFRTQVLTAKSVPPKAELAVDGAADSALVTVSVTAMGVDSTPAETLRLHVVLVEDSVRSDLVGATDSVFNGVMRAMLPGVEGTPVLLAPGETLRLTERAALEAKWNRTRLGVVAFLQESRSRRVIQTARRGRITVEE